MTGESEPLERLILRGDAQLKRDDNGIEERIQQQKAEIKTIQETLLDKIVMINMKDLSKIENDATEDRQKLFA